MQRAFSPLALAGLAGLGTLGILGCSQQQPELIRVLMVVGGQHHEYQTLPHTLAQRLTGRGEMNIDVTSDLASLDERKLKPYDVLLFNTCTLDGPGEPARRAVLEHVNSGKGLVAMHGALSSFTSWPEWAEMLGGYSPGHDPFGTYRVVVLDPAHATMLGLGGGFELTDEPYLVDRRDPHANVLIRTVIALKDPQDKVRPGPEPQVWVKHWGQGRVFVATFGHDERSQGTDQFISLLHNGIRWASGRLADTAHNVLTKPEQQAGFELLFDGKDLAGWSGDPRLWSVEDGDLVGRGRDLPHNMFLTCKKEYGDFLLRYSVKLLNHNSGVQFRSRQFPEYVVKGYQADVADQWYGSLYEEGLGRGVLANGFKGKGDQVVRLDGWNDMTVEAVGPKITITLNGLTTVEFVEKDAARPTSGVIALQLHQGQPMEVRFRDIRIRAMDQDKR